MKRARNSLGPLSPNKNRFGVGGVTVTGYIHKIKNRTLFFKLFFLTHCHSHLASIASFFTHLVVSWFDWLSEQSNWPFSLISFRSIIESRRIKMSLGKCCISGKFSLNPGRSSLHDTDSTWINRKKQVTPTLELHLVKLKSLEELQSMLLSLPETMTRRKHCYFSPMYSVLN